MIPFVLLWAVALGATPVAAASDSCDRRDDILALRRSDAPGRALLRARFDEEVEKSRGVGRACAAAVAAEAAILDGDKGRTLALLDDAAAGLPALAAALTPHRALLAAELGDVGRATTLLKDVSERSIVWRNRIELALARATKDQATTKTLLLKASARDPAALDELCALGARDRCVDLLVRHAGHPLARAREDAVDVGAFAVDVVDGRLKALLAAARPQRAVLEGQRWLAAHPTLGVVDGARRINADVGQALLRLNRNDEAVVITSGFADGARVDVDAARAHAKALGRAGKNREASVVWLALRDAALAVAPVAAVAPAPVAPVAVEAAVPRPGSIGPEVAAEASFFAAFALIEENDVDAALVALAAAAPLVGKTPWEIQTLWQRGFLTLTAKSDAATALPFFDAVVALNDKEVRKHRYWRARANAAAGHLTVATDDRQRLIAEDPLDWYGQLARRDLGKKPVGGQAVAATALVGLVAADAAAKAAAEPARRLFALGFDDEAKEACRALALAESPAPTSPSGSSPPAKKATSGRPSLASLGLCQAVDDANFGWKRGGLYLPAPMTKKNHLNPSPSWRVSYAMPWLDTVDAAAREAKIPRSFVYAIMRTESGFDAGAVSVAGARGALQLLPSVSRKIGGLVKHSGSRDVEDDIQLGAGLLGRLRAEHGSLLMAAAAYNGAPEFAAAWAKKFAGLPVDVFVERLPFKETRDYIKRVLAVEAVYRGLDGGEASLELPATIAASPTFTTFPYDE